MFALKNFRTRALESDLDAIVEQLIAEWTSAVNLRGLVAFQPENLGADVIAGLNTLAADLSNRHGAQAVTQFAADRFFATAEHSSQIVHGHNSSDLLTRLVVGCVLAQHPTPDLPHRLNAHLITIAEEIPDRQRRRQRRAFSYRLPNTEQCLWLLKRLPSSPEALDVVERIVTGELAIKPTGPRIMELLSRLSANGRLDYTLLHAAVLSRPALLLQYPQLYETAYLSPELKATLLDYYSQIASNLALDPTPDHRAVLNKLHVLTGKGAPTLHLQAAHIHADHIKKPVSQRKLGYVWADLFEGAVIRLARAANLTGLNAEESASFVEELRSFPATTLKALLPFTSYGRELVIEALGWEKAQPLIAMLATIAEIDLARPWLQDALANSGDPTSGVLDVIALRATLDQAGTRLAKQVIATFRKAGLSMTNTLSLVEAAAGWKEKWVLDKIERRHQPAVKAYGLLPLTGDEDEILERYLYLKRYAVDAAQFGAQRQANERAAVQVALANLAQLSGHGDVTRLEWAMEARLGSVYATPGEKWNLEKYTVTLVVDEAGRPGLEVHNGQRTLKSMPKAVRDTEAYEHMRASVDALRQQARRLRYTFEDAMASGTAFSAEDIANVNHLPMARELLTRLVCIDEQGVSGLFDPDEYCLITLDNARVPVTGALTIAHPYNLFMHEELARWQRAIINLHIVQPFKQVFRELYLLTPAEEETRTFSNRYAGQVIDPRVGSRLLQSRDWQIESGESALVYKVFPAAGITAWLAFPDAWQFLSRTDAITTDQVYFTPKGAPHWPLEKLPLDEIPPLIFSEVMRDADLVVSVAQIGEAKVLSPEAMQRRAEVVGALVADFGLQKVDVDGHFAYVKGRLAKYRVHLGSAVIHIMPGSYLCVVPDRRERRQDLYLPFADEDRKLSEVISKIILLANDHKIKDESILSQIKSKR